MSYEPNPVLVPYYVASSLEELRTWPDAIKYVQYINLPANKAEMYNTVTYIKRWAPDGPSNVAYTILDFWIFNKERRKQFIEWHTQGTILNRVQLSVEEMEMNAVMEEKEVEKEIDGAMKQMLELELSQHEELEDMDMDAPSSKRRKLHG